MAVVSLHQEIYISVNGCAVLFIGKVSGDVCHIYFSKMFVAAMASAYNCYLVIMWCNGLNCMLVCVCGDS